MGSLFATYASISATITLLQQAYHQFIPSPLRDRISIFCHRVFNRQSPTTFTLLVEEYHGLKTNPLFESLEAYLCNMISSKEASYLKATTESLGSLAPLELHIAREEHFKEMFNGFEIKWCFHCSSPQSNGRSKPMYSSWRYDDDEGKKGISEESRYIELYFLKIHKEDFFASYLPQVLLLCSFFNAINFNVLFLIKYLNDYLNNQLFIYLEFDSILLLLLYFVIVILILLVKI